MRGKGLTRRQFLIGSSVTGALVLTSGPRLHLEAATTPVTTGGTAPVLLQEQDVPPVVGARPKPPRKPHITQADRQAAADRSAAAGFQMPEVGVDQMTMPGSAPHYFSHPNYANSPLPGNIVSEWNLIAQNIVQPPAMPGMPMSGISVSAAFVYLSYVHAAVYNAMVAIEGGFAPYNSALVAPPTASREAAVATAAYTVLKHHFPADPNLDSHYADSLASLPDSVAQTDGIVVGQAAAAEIIALRAGDVLTGDGGYVLPAPGPGVWEPTVMMPDGVTPMPPMDPFMAQLQPFMRASISELRPVAAPDMTSAQYATDFNEVKDIGGAVSALRTPGQTEVAAFWTTNMVVQTNAGYRFAAETRAMSLLDTARLMALGNMAASDSLIATFDCKYAYSFWRPVTAIRRADTDGNDLTTADATWTPVLMTPNFPEYVAGHGSFASAQAEVYTYLFGTPQIEIDLHSTATGTTRHYVTADDLRNEVVDARTWGGMHFRSSTVLAVAIGQTLVTNALASYFGPAADKSTHQLVSGGIRKFVDTLAGLGATKANNLGQFIPVAEKDTTSYPGSDYYEIAVVQYREKMHSDLPPTLLRGYVQLSTANVPGAQVPLENALLGGGTLPTGYSGVTAPHYLGPAIVATKNRPVRVLFRNLLPAGVDGNLFIPVDVTVMGAGMGPALAGMPEPDPQNPMAGMIDPTYGKNPDCFAENRATLHLHGGLSPWISDGTPHQWITPADQFTSYPKGVSVQLVPDMADPGPGAMTFFYTNQQSARLMFYHDHAWGITRLNVYAGEAAPYIITDDTEAALLAANLIPGPEDTIPLVVQDKTFVPSAAQLAVSDELWDTTRWGNYGDIWVPHVYVPAQNPGDSSGVNQFGRWAYGPWFWPPTSNILYPPIANPYHDPLTCDPNDPTVWCEPPMMPGAPFVSMGMEAFNDTPLVNGTVYPTITLKPKAYRFRVLNAANDRFFNLSFYQADPLAPTEVQLNPAEVAEALLDPTVHPTPLAGTEGPDWIQIASEGGFLPAPAVIPAHVTTWVNDPTVFNAGNVDLHSLLVAPAERADVIVDFSGFAGQTLILYNDAPAAFPARDPRYDYYTGNGDYRDTGGAPSTLPGYGPNTRTVMQVVIENDIPASFDLPALEAAFMPASATNPTGLGVFQNGQHPIIVGQGAYNTAYNTAFVNNGAFDGLARITDFSLTFKTLSGVTMEAFPFRTKAIQDEMGEAFDHEYGRMSGNLGLEVPLTSAGTQQNLMLYPFVNPATELIDGTLLPKADVAVAPISSATDGTQIWKITHNGVDTHPVHFHLFEVQLLNRVGWDGIIRKPEPNELGWKETVRVSPLEDTIVALRPVLPVVPWELPNSVRPLHPMMPIGSSIQFNNVDADGNPTPAIVNVMTNFGWEYVWHCHILSHEEMDMMRPISVAVPPKAATLSGILTGAGANRRAVLNWVNNSISVTGWIVQRAGTANGPWTDLTPTPLPVGTTTYTNVIGTVNAAFFYRVLAVNTVGYTFTAGWWSIPASSISNTVKLGTVQTAPPLAPTNLTATLQAGPQVLLTWRDNASNENGFSLERAVNGGAFTQLRLIGARAGTGNVSYTDTTVAMGNTYQYRVAALNSFGPSAYSNTVSVSLLQTPAPPTNVQVTAVVAGGNSRATLTWVDNAVNETGYQVQRSTDATFTNRVTTNVAANATTLVVQGLARFTPYYFRVRAINAAGGSAWVNATPFPIVTP